MWKGDSHPRLLGVSVTTARSFLFVPGNRRDRFDKARTSGADLVICDLEDAVEPDSKSVAREQVVSWLSDEGGTAVRINSTESPWYAQDCAAIAELPGLVAVMVPKAENVEKIKALHEVLGDRTPIIALIETALGAYRAFEIAQAAGVARLAFGSLDYALDIAASDDDNALLQVRSSLVLMSRAAGIASPIDGVTTQFDNLAAVKADAVKSRRLGFSGKLCIHPRQVSEVNAAFIPSAEEVLHANRIVEKFDAGGLSQLDGEMIDKPVVDRARQLLLRYELFKSAGNPESKSR